MGPRQQVSARPPWSTAGSAGSGEAYDFFYRLTRASSSAIGALVELEASHGPSVLGGAPVADP